MRRTFLFISIYWFGLNSVFAQEETSDNLFKVVYDTPLTIELKEEAEEEEEVTKKKKVKPNFYYGYKTKKQHTRQRFGKTEVIELFNYLKEYQPPPPFARNFFWYNFKKKRIVNSLKVDVNNAAVLHGSYKKMKGEQVIEEGYFYKGMKHKRWKRYNSHDILQDKEQYWKGWPKESLLSYYDFERTKLREVIPVHFGEKKGEYWAFHANGNIAVRGLYKFDHRVGVWREYYPNKRVKREVSFPEDPFNFKHKVVILKEWDTNGQVIYDRKKFLEKLK